MENNKIYYHVVMGRSGWKIVESHHKNPSEVQFSVISYAIRKHAEQNISDPSSRHYGQVKKRW